METTSLQKTVIARTLQQRSTEDEISAALYGSIQLVLSDSRPLLEYIRHSFPAYPSHGLDHSIRILNRIGRILSRDALEDLSSAEIFGLIVAALFHDIGMVAPDVSRPNDETIRKNHPSRSRDFVVEYMATQTPQIGDQRLSHLIGFVIEAHGLEWESMRARPEFMRIEMVFDQTVRTSILAILLRIGDLLDLDASRTNVLCIQHCFNWIDAHSLEHHERHRCVRHFLCNTHVIEVHVECRTRLQHQIWSQWLDYLRQDIEKANTYIFSDELAKYRLPAPDLQITMAKDATYSVTPIRFELDDEGALWEVLRRSVYTGRLDFIRELVQNGIDAGLRFLYDRDDTDLSLQSPRSWKNRHFEAYVILFYSHSLNKLAVFDNGIGMSPADLQLFLFRVAKSGVRRIRNDRRFPFPSIASFGIGFTSVLTRANTILISTCKEAESETVATLVELLSGQRDAYLERAAAIGHGSSFVLTLSFELHRDELSEYMRDTFVFPGVSLFLIDVDHLNTAKKRAMELNAVLKGQRIAIPEAVDYFDARGCVNYGAEVRKLRVFARALRRVESMRSSTPNISAPGTKIAPFINEVPRGREISAPLKEPLFLQLGGDLSAIRVENNYCGGTGIVIVPIHLEDLEKGVEWASIHLLLIHKGDIRRLLMSFDGHLIVAAESEYDYLPEEFTADFDRPNELMSFEDDRLFTPRMVSRLQAYPNGLAFEDRLATRDRRVSGTATIKEIVKSTFTSSDVDHGILDQLVLLTEEETANAHVAAVLRVSAWFRNYSEGRIYQDGIRLPITIRDLVSIGASSGVLNLTASARLRLNVARNAIDKSPHALEDWQASTGDWIVERIASRVREALARLRLEAEWGALWITHDGAFCAATGRKWRELG